jgi:hypothetical protein
VGRAAAIFGDTPGLRGDAERAARQYDPAWVFTALDSAEQKQRRAGEVDWGYVLNALKIMAEQGGPRKVKYQEPTAEDYARLLRD